MGVKKNGIRRLIRWDKKSLRANKAEGSRRRTNRELEIGTNLNNIRSVIEAKPIRWLGQVLRLENKNGQSSIEQKAPRKKEKRDHKNEEKTEEEQ